MRKTTVRSQIVVRVLADLIMLNSASLIAILPQMFFRSWSLTSAFNMWLPMAFVLSFAGPYLFYEMGFYTKGRSYNGKFKSLVVAEGALILFVIAGAGLYFLKLRPEFPRSSFLLAWISCSLVLLG